MELWRARRRLINGLLQLRTLRLSLWRKRSLHAQRSGNPLKTERKFCNVSLKSTASLKLAVHAPATISTETLLRTTTRCGQQEPHVRATSMQTSQFGCLGCYNPRVPCTTFSVAFVPQARCPSAHFHKPLCKLPGGVKVSAAGQKDFVPASRNQKL